MRPFKLPKKPKYIKKANKNPTKPKNLTQNNYGYIFKIHCHFDWNIAKQRNPKTFRKTESFKISPLRCYYAQNDTLYYNYKQKTKCLDQNFAKT